MLNSLKLKFRSVFYIETNSLDSLLGPILSFALTLVNSLCKQTHFKFL